MTNFVKQISLCFLLALFFTGCQNKKGTTSILKEAEALMYTRPDSALQILETISQPEKLTGQEQADYALLLTQARSRNRITATSDSLIRIASDYYQDSNDNARKAKAFLYLGDVYMDMQKYPEAVVPLKEAENIVEDAEESVQSLIYSRLGYLNRKSGNYELALEYYGKALSINMSNHYDEWSVGNLTNILNLPLSGMHDNALVYIKRLEAILPNIRPELQAKAYNNIGVYYEDVQQRELAATYYQKAIQTSTSVPYRAYLNLAQIYESKGDIEHADSLYQIALQSSVWATKIRIYEALYKRNWDKGNYKEAATYMKLYKATTDSFHIQRETQKIQDLQKQYNNEVLAHEKTEAEMHLYRFIAGTTILFFITIFTVYRLYLMNKLQQQKQFQQIQDQIKKISDLKNSQKGLERENEKKDEEIVHLNYLLKESRILNEDFLQSKGEWTSMDDVRTLSWYIHLRMDLSSYNSIVDYPILCHWLNMVGDGLANRFTEKHPNLRTTEKTLCYLRYVGFTYSQVAEILHVKESSITRYVYRICEGLNLPKSKSEFEKYLHTF